MSWSGKMALAGNSRFSSPIRKFIQRYPEYMEHIKDDIPLMQKSTVAGNGVPQDQTKDEQPLKHNSYLHTGIAYLQKLTARSSSPNGSESPKPAKSNFKNALSTVNNLMPQSLQQNQYKEINHIPHWMKHKSNLVSKASIDQRTRHLVKSIGLHLTDAGKLRRLESLNKHIYMYPQAKGVAVKNQCISRILAIMNNSNDIFVHEEGRECLALLGHVAPVNGQGLRILSIDGGGIRGLVALELLREIENKVQKPIHEIFDYIGGVSSGAILAILLGAQRLSISECEALYRELGTKVFSQTTIKGATSLMMNNSYYNSDTWSQILKDSVGDKQFITTNRKEKTPKICVVSTQATNTGTKPFLFRNYEMPYRVSSHYNGSCRYHLWQSARASAAAPGYFSEYKVDNKLLMDGGVLVNNPTAILLHEAKQLWPNAKLQCLLSIGTGKHEPINNEDVSTVNISTLFRALLASATDTEGVHTMLHDMMPDNAYYRFNPYLSDEFGLDEIRDERIDLMMEDTYLYIRKNDHKFNEVVEILKREKSKFDKLQDWMAHQSQIRY